MSFIRLPEVEIPLPERIVYAVEGVHSALSTAYQWLRISSEWFTISAELYQHLRANALLLICVSLIFWPLLLSLVTAATVMGTWSFWLLTTAVFGVLQLFYVVYQFIMIFFDILGLSLFKTYTMVRNRILMYIGKAGVNDQSRSRRLVWRERLEEAGNYENFLKVQIEAHVPEPKKLERRRSDPAIMRSTSHGNMEQLDSPKRISRNRSYSSLITAGSEDVEPVHQAADPEVVDELGEMAALMLTTTKQRLKEARQTALIHEDDSAAASTLKQLLQGVVKRNHLNLDNFLIKNARTVASQGQYGLSSRSRKVIHAYFEEVEKGLDWIADAPIAEGDSPNSESIMEGDEADEGSNEFPFFDKTKRRTAELNERINLVRKIRANVGRTSLMLSGGGAQAMYHLGVVRALIESNVYQDIKVISGTSGGSITAAMCALKTPEELHKHVCVSTVSTDYMLTGEQGRRNIRWFPTVSRLQCFLFFCCLGFLTCGFSLWNSTRLQLTDMAKTWLKTKLMVDSAVSSESTIL